MLDKPLPVDAALAGIGDAIELTREAAQAIGDERRTQTVTRRHLAEAIEAIEPLSKLGAADRNHDIEQTDGAERTDGADRTDGAARPPTPAAWAARLAELEAGVGILTDVAGALTAERGDGTDGELVTWAEAAPHPRAQQAHDLPQPRAASPAPPR